MPYPSVLFSVTLSRWPRHNYSQFYHCVDPLLKKSVHASALLCPALSYPPHLSPTLYFASCLCFPLKNTKTFFFTALLECPCIISPWMSSGEKFFAYFFINSKKIFCNLFLIKIMNLLKF